MKHTMILLTLILSLNAYADTETLDVPTLEECAGSVAWSSLTEADQIYCAEFEDTLVQDVLETELKSADESQ